VKKSQYKTVTKCYNAEMIKKQLYNSFNRKKQSLAMFLP